MSILGGRVVVVTGASRGIGDACARAFRGTGARVVRIARSLADGWHDGARDFAADLTDPAAVDRVASAVLGEFGPPEVVVSNAGAFLLKPLEATTPEELDAQLAVNLRAPYLVARAFLPAMRHAGRGVLVHLGSVADHAGFPDNSAYAAAKWGLRGLHETLIAEYRGSGVRLALVSPGPTDTSVWDPVDPDNRPGFPPRAAMLRPADVADAVVYVATRPAHVHVDWLRLGPA